ncbi:putative ribonuclease H-like domain-containing protein [Tanacetum coccineum]
MSVNLNEDIGACRLMQKSVLFGDKNDLVILTETTKLMIPSVSSLAGYKLRGFGVESSSSKESDNSSENTNSTESLYPNFQKAKGFHAVPPPTGTIIPPRANVSFTGIDELAIRNKVVNQENTKSSQPEIDRNKVIIEDWVLIDEDEETSIKTILRNSKENYQEYPPQAVLHKVSVEVLIFQGMDNIGPRTLSYSPSNNGFLTQGLIPHRPQRPKKIYNLSGLRKLRQSRQADLKDLCYNDESLLLKKSSLEVYLPRQSSLSFMSWHIERVKPAYRASCQGKIEGKKNSQRTFVAKKGNQERYSIARSSTQNGVAERKNRTLIEAARTMLADSLLPIQFWAEAVNTACYDQENQKGKGPDWMFDLELLTPSMNYIPVRKENYADSGGKVSTYDEVEDLDDQQFIVHVPSINAAQNKHSRERTSCELLTKNSIAPLREQAALTLNEALVLLTTKDRDYTGTGAGKEVRWLSIPPGWTVIAFLMMIIGETGTDEEDGAPD